MGLITKKTETSMEVVADGSIQVRKAIYILEDGEVIAGPLYHRQAYVPGADISAENDRVKSVANVVWTDDVIQSHREKLK